MSKKVKNTSPPDLEKTIKELNDLVYSPGYIYSLLTISANDLLLPLDKYVDVNWWDRISYQEIGYLFGLLIKKPLDLSVHPLQSDSEKQIENTYRLLKQLHDYYSFKAFDSMIGEALKQKEELGEVLPTKTRVYTSPEAVVESIFYSDSGAYDYQYWESAPNRYEQDRDWILENLGFSIEDVVEISQEAKTLCESKVRPPKKIHSQEEFDNWVLKIFSFSESELKHFTENKKRALQQLSVYPGKTNKELKYISDYNELLVKPLIKISDDEYLLPVSFDLARAADESPFYWIRELDEEYFKKSATAHRGEYTELASYEYFAKVFGEKNVFLDVNINRKKAENYKKKGKTHTDIDVLALYGDRAVIVQSKSKKLTLPARQGDATVLAKDFKSAVQDAYDQGLKARKLLLSGSDNIELKSEGRLIEFKTQLKEAYIITVTTDNYPTISFQVHNFLERKTDDPYPIAINLYDLDILTEYLTDPIDFLFYVHQKTSLADVIVGSHEIACLGYHLDQKLYLDPRDGYTHIHIASDFGQLIDDDVMRQRYGDKKDKAKSRIRQKWKNESYERLIDQLKRSRDPHLIDAIFFLLLLSSETVDELVELMDKSKKKSLSDQKSHNFSMELDNMAGISYVSEYSSTQNLHKHLLAYSRARKYLSKKDEWLGLGSYANSENIIDSLVYSKKEWGYDPHLESYSRTIIPKPGQLLTRKIGRNDPCYCGSGKKYKKCCYLKK